MNKSIILTISLIFALTLTTFGISNPTNIKPKKNMTKLVVLNTKRLATKPKLIAKVTVKTKIVKPTVHISTKAEISKLPVNLNDLYNIKDGLMDGNTLMDQHKDLMSFLELPVSLTARTTYNTDAYGLNKLMLKMANEYMNKVLNFDYKKGLKYYTNLTKDFYSINSRDNFTHNFLQQIKYKVVTEGIYFTKEDLTYNGAGALVRGKVRIIFHSAEKDYFKSQFKTELKLNQWYEIPYEVDVPFDGADTYRHLKVNGLTILNKHIKEINNNVK